ncbi:hypothetical protein PR048_033050 [Dryococelus australis]|uniref:Uncharacterized protein n=1 Tax=Dryococelus australis TaxID=614101 RepID=A0ABQ9FZ69_9NEOP|nr:hypothetical protein PR048_033050 [Dryococelus australis]
MQCRWKYEIPEKNRRPVASSRIITAKNATQLALSDWVCEALRTCLVSDWLQRSAECSLLATLPAGMEVSLPGADSLTWYAVRRKHCAPVESLELSGDGAFDVRSNAILIVPTLLRLKLGKQLQVAYQGTANKLTYDLSETNTHALPAILTQNFPYPSTAAHQPTEPQEVGLTLLRANQSVGKGVVQAQVLENPSGISFQVMSISKASCAAVYPCSELTTNQSVGKGVVEAQVLENPSGISFQVMSISKAGCEAVVDMTTEEGSTDIVPSSALTEEQQRSLDDCEAEFANRYTDDDLEYVRERDARPGTPPSVVQQDTPQL